VQFAAHTLSNYLTVIAEGDNREAKRGDLV
jgi:hypothetical protein